jgi:hypothetical protein
MSDVDELFEKVVPEDMKLAFLEARIKEKAYMKTYNTRPDVKTKRKAYAAHPDVKAKKKAYMKTYNARPDVKAKRKAYNAHPDVKAKRKAYYARRYQEKKRLNR